MYGNSEMATHRISTFWSDFVSAPVPPLELCRFEDIAKHPLPNRSDLRGAMVFTDDIVDAKRRFRVVRRNGQLFIAKRCNSDTANAEVRLSAKANAALESQVILDKVTLRVLQPIEVIQATDSKDWVITPYIGPSLQHNGARIAKPQEIFGQIEEVFASSGLYWSGNAPRNMAYDGDKKQLTLFDFEALKRAELKPKIRTRLSRNIYTHDWQSYAMLSNQPLGTPRVGSPTNEPPPVPVETEWVKYWGSRTTEPISAVRDEIHTAFLTMTQIVPYPGDPHPAIVSRALGDVDGLAASVEYLAEMSVLVTEDKSKALQRHVAAIQKVRHIISDALTEFTS